MAEAQTLEQSITKAVGDQPKSDSTAEEPKVDPIKTEIIIEPKVEPKTEEGDGLGLDDVERKQAAQLYAALKNPEQAPTVLKFLAEQAGYIKTEKQAEGARDDILSVLKEHLGPEFEVIADRIGPALDKIITKKLKEGQAAIVEKIAKQEEAKLHTEMEVALTSIAKEYYDTKELPEEVLAEMNKAMSTIEPAANMSMEDYMNNLFAIVAFKRGIAKKTDTSKRTERNRTDAPSRLASGGPSPKEGDKVQGPMTLKSAVEKAVEQVNQELK